MQACEEAPPDKRKQFYLMWADFEEKYGLARHCFGVYEKAARAVPKAERAAVYRLFVAKAKELMGIPKVQQFLVFLRHPFAWAFAQSCTAQSELRIDSTRAMHTACSWSPLLQFDASLNDVASTLHSYQEPVK